MIFKTVIPIKYWIPISLIILALGLYLTNTFRSNQKDFQSITSVKRTDDETPTNVVRKFWDISLEGKVIEASKCIHSAPISYLEWKPDSPISNATSNKESAKKDGNGTGGSDSNYTDERFSNQLKDTWAKTIYKNQLKIDEVSSEKIEYDKAEVVLGLKKDGFVSSYKVRVLLRRVDENWKIVAIWDWIT